MQKQIDDNLFVRIISGEIPCEKVYEDEHSFAFLSIEPNTKGHTIVVPKEYSRNVLDISETSIQRLVIAVQKVAILVKDRMQADGVNIIHNSESSAGQVVFHTHFHVIPRYAGDGLIHWATSKPTREELRVVAEQIRS